MVEFYEGDTHIYLGLGCTVTLNSETLHNYIIMIILKADHAGRYFSETNDLCDYLLDTF